MFAGLWEGSEGMVGLPECLEMDHVLRAIHWRAEFAPQPVYSQADEKHFVKTKMSLLLGTQSPHLITGQRVFIPPLA